MVPCIFPSDAILAVCETPAKNVVQAGQGGVDYCGYAPYVSLAAPGATNGTLSSLFPTFEQRRSWVTFVDTLRPYPVPHHPPRNFAMMDTCTIFFAPYTTINHSLMKHRLNTTPFSFPFLVCPAGVAEGGTEGRSRERCRGGSSSGCGCCGGSGSSSVGSISRGGQPSVPPVSRRRRRHVRIAVIFPRSLAVGQDGRRSVLTRRSRETPPPPPHRTVCMYHTMVRTIHELVMKFLVPSVLLTPTPSLPRGVPSSTAPPPLRSVRFRASR